MATTGWASSDAIRKTMQGCRSRDTAPELILRSAVHARGLRFRVAARPLPNFRRTADLVFRAARVAVFLDGCYWHGCPEHYRAPATNVDYWSSKISGNRARDLETDQRLLSEGWLPLRFWEHDDPQLAADIVAQRVKERLATPSGCS